MKTFLAKKRNIFLARLFLGQLPLLAVSYTHLTQTGKKFRLRGKGAPSLRGGAVGDQYVTVNVVTPTGLNDRQKAALKEFAAAGDLKVNPKKKGFFDHIKDAFEGE